MSLAEFKKGLSEQYQGEVIGEVFFCGLLERFDSPQHRYKLVTLLQLETETKARLRPAVLELGLELVELDDSRKMGHEFVKSCDGMDWKGTMARLATIVEHYVKRYSEIAEIAPPEYKDLADSMVVHEASIRTAARLEASGDTEHSLDDVIKQLKFPLNRRS
jgi:hypothetical protein